MEITMSNMKGPSIIVEPDAPWRFVFWSGAQYVACLARRKRIKGS
ncbi:MAG: hypothetical protein QXP45_01175 [Thermoproteota archaeon]